MIRYLNPLHWWRMWRDRIVAKAFDRAINDGRTKLSGLECRSIESWVDDYRKRAGR